MAGSNNVVSIIHDNRLVDFTDRLDAWIHENNNNLPSIAIVGALEHVKQLIILESLKMIDPL